MPDDTIYVHRFILSQPHRGDGDSWLYQAEEAEAEGAEIRHGVVVPCVLPPGITRDQVLDQVAVQSQLVHPRIQRLYAGGFKGASGPGLLYAIVDAMDPARRVDRILLPNAPVTEQTILTVGIELLDALAAMVRYGGARGWLGPEHVFVGEDGHLLVTHPWLGWVQDLARQASASGTANWQFTWTAPEVIGNPAAAGIHSDVFTVCAICFALATGRPPYESASELTLASDVFTVTAPDARSFNPAISAGLAAVLRHGLEPDSTRRYAIPMEMREHLVAILKGERPDVPGYDEAAPVAVAPAANAAQGSGPHASRATPASRRSRSPEARQPRRAGSERVRPSATMSGGHARRTGPERGTGAERAPREPCRKAASPLPFVWGAIGLAVIAFVVVLVVVLREPPAPVEPVAVPPSAAQHQPSETSETSETSEPRPSGRVYRPFGLDAPPQLPELSGHGESRVAVPREAPDSSPEAQPVQDAAPAPDALTAADMAPADIAVDQLESGLAYHLYRRSGPNVLADIIDEQCRTETGVVRNFDITKVREMDGVGLKFSGYIQFPADGRYQFRVSADDGAALRIGPYVMTIDGTHDVIRENMGVTVTAGWYPIELTYFNARKNGALELLIRSGKSGWRQIPSRMLARLPGGLSDKLPPLVVDADYQPGLHYWRYGAKSAESPEMIDSYLSQKVLARGVDDEFRVGSLLAGEPGGLRFFGALFIDVAGTYEFRMTSDDGSRLRIAGRDIVIHDGAHDETERRHGRTYLAEGYHDIELAYFDLGANRRLNLEWRQKTGTWRRIHPDLLWHKLDQDEPPAFVPWSNPVQLGKAGQGLWYELFRGEDDGNWDINTTQKPDKTGIAPDFSLSPRGSENDHFGIRYSGFIRIPADGVYTFDILVDDWARFEIGEFAIWHHREEGIAGRKASVWLAAGDHPVRMIYTQWDGDRLLNLTWQHGAGEARAVPRAALLHDGSVAKW
ncbi:MAG: PA14 domain-containing protein [Planctomycetota bacterium]|jgi:hypothetical protein|nr:PA14 domain-containing protein [Planctomycetota bacterium]